MKIFDSLFCLALDCILSHKTFVQFTSVNIGNIVTLAVSSVINAQIMQDSKSASKVLIYQQLVHQSFFD